MLTTPLLLLVGACAPPAADTGEAPAPPAPVDPDRIGPYAVGASTILVPDDRGGTLKVEVWYPAIDPGTEPERYPEIAFPGGAHRDADPDTRGAPYPLVAFSHGFGGIRYQSAFLTERLASHGLVVVAPDHRNNTLLDLDDDLTGQVLVDRPGDVIRAVDGGLAFDPLAGLADASRYAVVGHSFGGLTALMVGGGVLDIEHGLTHCEAHDDAGCRFLEDRQVGDPGRVEADPRAVVAVDLSPGGWYAFGERGLDGVVPTLAIGGDRDEDLPYASEARPTMERLPPPKRLVTLANAGHWGMTDLCSIITTLVDCRGADGGWMEPERVHDVVNTLVTAWVIHALTDQDRSAWLLPEAWPETDVTLEAVDP